MPDDFPTLNFRIPDELRRQIEECGRLHARTLAAEIRAVLELHAARTLLAIIDSPRGADVVPDARERAAFRERHLREIADLEREVYRAVDPTALLAAVSLN